MDLHVLTHSSPTRRSSELETSRKRGYRLIAKVLFPDDYRRAPTLAGPWTHGNPYVGLSAFDDQHAEVFFGRSRMTAKLLGALRRQIDSQRRFVLLVGASGCGFTLGVHSRIDAVVQGLASRAKVGKIGRASSRESVCQYV